MRQAFSIKPVGASDTFAGIGLSVDLPSKASDTVGWRERVAGDIDLALGALIRKAWLVAVAIPLRAAWPKSEDGSHLIASDPRVRNALTQKLGAYRFAPKGTVVEPEPIRISRKQWGDKAEALARDLAAQNPGHKVQLVD